MPPRSANTTQDVALPSGPGGGRRRLPDPFVEPLAGASARLMHQRVLADPLEFDSLESRGEVVISTIEIHVRPQDRRARASSWFKDGVDASIRRERRKGPKPAHTDRHIEQSIRVGNSAVSTV